MDNHEEKVSQLEATLADHKKGPIPNKGLPLQNYKEKETYLQYEVRQFHLFTNLRNCFTISEKNIYYYLLKNFTTLSIILSVDIIQN